MTTNIDLFPDILILFRCTCMYHVFHLYWQQVNNRLFIRKILLTTNLVDTFNTTLYKHSCGKYKNIYFHEETTKLSQPNEVFKTENIRYYKITNESFVLAVKLQDSVT